MSLVIIVWVDQRGRMSKAKRKQRERDRERIVVRKKQREPLLGVAVLVRSALERVLQIFGYLCVIGLQNERKSTVLVFEIHFIFRVVAFFCFSDVEF